MSCSAKASTICWVVHAAVGWSVTLKCSTSRRRCSNTMNTNSIFKVIVGTVKKFNRNHLTEVIAQERLPSLAGRPRQSSEDSGDSTFGNLDAEHCQLAVSPECAPERVGGNHPLDRVSNLDGRRGSPAMASVHPRPPSPEPAKPFALPADDRVGADVNQGSAPAGPQQGQPHPE